MTDITVHKPDGSTYNINIPEFHKEPYYEISTACEDPEAFVRGLIEKYEGIKTDLAKDSKMFPGDTNFTGHAIDEVVKMINEVLYFLKKTQIGEFWIL